MITALKPTVAYAAVLAALALGAGPARAQTPAAAATPAARACVVGTHAGIPDADALTVASMVCEEVRAQGQPVAAPVTEATGPRYVVSMQKLGESVVLRLTEFDATDGVVAGRILNLEKIEDVPVAAPRIARAVVDKVPIEATRQMDNLVGAEARVQPKMDGEALWSLGVLTGFVTGAAMSMPLVGADLGASYEMGDWGITANMRFGVSSSSNVETRSGEAAMFTLSVGARYFFDPSDGSLFTGGGLGFDALTVDEIDGILPAPYAEVGYELFRLAESRLAIAVRADVPLGSMAIDEYTSKYSDECNDAGRCGSGYLLPVTLSVSYAF
jgi:hypothetical protein